jgi:DNA-binding response OmpR family regulator
MGKMKKKILVVEDSFEVRIALEMALEQEGYEVHAVVDAEAGEDMFKQLDPDLALLDVRLPGMTGIEFCSIIRESSPIPVVIFSAVEEAAEKMTAFQAGADDYVMKGTGVDELLARVAAHLKWDRKPVSAVEQDHGALTEPNDVNAESSAAAPERPAQQMSSAQPNETPHRPRLPKRRIDVPRFEGAQGTAILVADPDAQARDRLVRMLKRLGHEVIEAENGRLALKTIGKYLPWVIFSETVMPDMNGMKMIELLKNHPKTQDLAVVVISSDGSPKSRSLGTKLGILDYIIKPWEDHEIELRIKWVQDALERRSLRRSESSETDPNAAA